ncbi:hypothetical protein BTHE68_51140 [Burkholderia sp. THE68]|nr:hypothetical protein BTHE68_51140 [Burkholderia sp. THE68]
MLSKRIAHSFTSGLRAIVGIGVLRQHRKPAMPQTNEISRVVEECAVVIYTHTKRVAVFSINECVDERNLALQKKGLEILMMSFAYQYDSIDSAFEHRPDLPIFAIEVVLRAAEQKRVSSLFE